MHIYRKFDIAGEEEVKPGSETLNAELTVLFRGDRLEDTEISFGFDIFGDGVCPSTRGFTVAKHDAVGDGPFRKNDLNRLGRISCSEGCVAPSRNKR